MLTRRDVLRIAPAPFLMQTACAAQGVDFERIDTHIHREAPALYASLRDSRWSGLDIVVCPAAGDEPFDLESRLDSTLKGARASGGRRAWASTFDARGFEDRGFPDRTIARLRKSFDDGAIGRKPSASTRPAAPRSSAGRTSRSASPARARPGSGTPPSGSTSSTPTTAPGSIRSRCPAAWGARRPGSSRPSDRASRSSNPATGWPTPADRPGHTPRCGYCRPASWSGSRMG